MMKAAASTFTLGSVISLTGSNPMVRNIQGGLSIQPLQETPNNPHSSEAVSMGLPSKTKWGDFLISIMQETPRQNCALVVSFRVSCKKI